MEEETEKMAALKRAYADIILNTSKESAARILVAERRALGFQQSLFEAKEEAVATMLRLKAVMEGKIRDAEKAARCQEKKIEELELQLGEAEDTIVDLREELKRVREELTVMKDVSVQHMSEGNINDTDMAGNNIEKETTIDNLEEPGNMSTTGDNTTTLNQKIADTHHYRIRNVAIAEYPIDISIWRGNAPELYSNGYTQRIHAVEHNLNLKGPFGEISGLYSYSKCEPHTYTDEKLGIAFKTDSLRSVERAIQVKDPLMVEEGCCRTIESEQLPTGGGEDHIKFLSNFSPKKQVGLYSQSHTSSDCIVSDNNKSCNLSDGTSSDKYKSHASRSMLAVHDEQNKTEAPMETSSPSISMSTEINSIEEQGISSQCKLDTSMKTLSMGIKHCTEGMTSESVNRRQNQLVCENEMQNFIRGSDVKDSSLSRPFSKIGGHPSAKSTQNDLEDIIEATVASREEAENLDNSITVKLDTNGVTTGSAQTGTDKFLKYTFQRKRKRGCSPIKNEIAFPEKKLVLKPKSMDKQTSLPLPSKSNVITELPRNNRRVVQVARQLISLSEKRW